MPSASASAQYVRVHSPQEDTRDLQSRLYGCHSELADARRLLVIVAVFLAIIAALMFTGYSAIVAGVVLAILAICFIALTGTVVSALRTRREIEAQLRESKRSPSQTSP